MKRFWFALCLICSGFQLQAMESLTGSDSSYLDMCEKAVSDSFYFHFFRSFPEYSHVVEIYDGDRFAKQILNAGDDLVSRLDQFRKLDMIGTPIVCQYPGLGDFSATTLRYIVVADHIRHLFDLPQDAKIVEIGGGFGGQCYIFSALQGFSQYFIYDLPQVNPLIEKLLSALSVRNAVCLNAWSSLPEESVDLLISNYSFSEFSRETQMDYFERVIKKADRGYIIFHQIARTHFGLDCLTPLEFYQLLDEAGMNPSVHEEQIQTFYNNVLFTWDRTAL